MLPNNKKNLEITENRLNFQRNYEPKLRGLVETRTNQLGFTASQRDKALKSIDALMWKLTAAGIHLERLWDYHESSSLKFLLKNINRYNFDPKRFTDKEVAYLTCEFEAYLIQARAFINVAQIHTLDACRVTFGGVLTNEKYEKKVYNASPEVRNRLISANNLFTQEVFGKGKWGALLKSLRDRVVHFDRIRPSLSINSESEQLNVTGLSIEQLAQDFENGHYYILVNIITPIWERKWIPGSYIPGMWN